MKSLIKLSTYLVSLLSRAHQNKDVTSLHGQETRVVCLLVAYGPEQILLVQAGEGRLANQHLV